jgi:hypothetical protein
MGTMTGIRLRLAAAAQALSSKPTEMPTDSLAHADDDYYPQFVSEVDGLRTIDDLVARKGLAPYREMPTRDEQVASCLGYLVFARLSSGYSCTPASGDEVDKRVCAAWEDNQKRLKQTSVLRLMQNSMEAIHIGFSVQEKVWDDPNKGGDFKGLQYYKTFRPIPQETVTFKQDAFGQLEPDGMWQAKPHMPMTGYTAPGAYNHLPVDRFIIWNWQQRSGNRLGLSVLRPAYRWYMWKDMQVRWWAKYMERHGHPWVVGEHEETDPKKRADMMRKLSRFLIDHVLLLKRGQKVDVRDPGTTAVANFDAAITKADRALARCIFIPALLTETGDTTGSYALGKSQKGVFEWPLDHLAETLQTEVMGEQVLRPWVDHNFGPDVDIPNWKFKEFSEPDRVVIATVFKILKDLGVPLGVSRIRQALGEPEPDPEDQLVGGAEDDPDQSIPPESLDQAKIIDGLLADMLAASGSNSEDDLINVIRGNGKLTKQQAVKPWE